MASVDLQCGTSKTSSEFQAARHKLYQETKLITIDGIRIFELLPGPSKNLPIRANLVIGSAAKDEYSRPYEGLSYAWGESDESCRIIVNGKQILVRQNLFGALLHLRRCGDVDDLSKTRSLWIDAICINQDDTDERTAQIAMMATIYRNATQTIAWLGPDSAEGDGSKTMRFLEWTARPHITPYAKDMTKNIRKAIDDYNREVHNQDAMSLDLLLAFANRAYFRRRWMVQEVGVASSLELLCGDSHNTKSKIFGHLADIPGQMEVAWDNLFYTLPVAATRPFRRLLTIDTRNVQYHGGTQVMLSALEEFCDTKCSDPRDCIATMLWICPALKFAVDYNRSTEQVYKDFFKAVMEQGTYCILGLLHAAARRRHDPCHDLPSWVPDWRIYPRKGGPELELLPPTTEGSQETIASISVSWYRITHVDSTDGDKLDAISGRVLDLSFQDCVHAEALVSTTMPSVIQSGDHLICPRSTWSTDTSIYDDLIGSQCLVLRPLSLARVEWIVVGYAYLDHDEMSTTTEWPPNTVKTGVAVHFRLV